MTIKGWLPNRLTLTLQRGECGKKAKLVFKEWHNVTDEEFTEIDSYTQATVDKLRKAYSHLNLRVQFKAYPKDKAYEVIYVGKDIRPAISGIIWELMPLLVRNKAEALPALDMLFQAVKVAASLEDLASHKEH